MRERVRRKSFSDSTSLGKTEQNVRVRRKSDPLRSTGSRRAPTSAARTLVPLKFYERVASTLGYIGDEDVRLREKGRELDLMKDYFDRVSAVVEESCARGSPKCVGTRARLRECLNEEATLCAKDAVQLSATHGALKVMYNDLCSDVGVIRDSCAIAGPLFDEASESEARAAADNVMAAYASNYLPREPPTVNGLPMTGPPTIDGLNNLLRASLLASKGRDEHADAVRSSPHPAALARTHRGRGRGGCASHGLRRSAQRPRSYCSRTPFIDSRLRALSSARTLSHSSCRTSHSLRVEMSS